MVAILGILAAIATPIYQGYITSSKIKAAESVLAQFPVLLETYRAENGSFPANATYSYTENDAGAVTANTITTTAGLTDFRAKNTTGSDPILYDYQLVIIGSGTASESATFTATPVTSRGAPTGTISRTYP